MCKFCANYLQVICKFIIESTLSKIGCLLHKSGFVDSQLLPTVIMNPIINPIIKSIKMKFNHSALSKCRHLLIREESQADNHF